jgi:hypothetical protein
MAARGFRGLGSSGHVQVENVRSALLIGLAVSLALGAVGARAQLVVDTEVVTWSRSACDPALAYVNEMRASGGSGDYEWRVIAGQVPPGTRLKIGGHWAGEPDSGWFKDNPDATIDVEVLDVETSLVAHRAVRLRADMSIRQEGYCGDPWDCSATPARGLPWAILITAFVAATNRRLGRA